MGPRKLANSAHDLRHWAELCGAEFSPDARKSRPDPGLLTRAALVAKDAGRFRDYHYPAFRARWADASDISDPQVVRALLSGAGLDADAALERARSDELQQRLDDESRQAVERGVFGAPTLFVGDEMFWGNDRFELVRHYIQKSQG
jgi:2-hydroxychromene-2-carboxylate isomerase